MPVIAFHNAEDPTAHENFVRWCHENREAGLFVNFGSQGAMLHRVTSPHTADWNRPEWGDLGNNRKLCAHDEQELLEHVQRELGKPAAKCADCF